jgi:integrase
VSESSIGLDFYYRGVRCRERIKLPPTPRNQAYARNLLGQIKVEIAKGTFDYARHFPHSPKVKLFAAPAPASELATIEQGLRAWLARKRPDIEHTTAIDYRRAIDRTLVPAFGALKQSELTRRKVRDWMALHPDLSAKRLNNVLSPLRQMYAELLADEIIDENPLHDLVIVRRKAVKEVDDIDPFTPSEIATLLASATGQFRNMIAFGVGSGFRWPSEVIALRWADVDLKAGTARVRAAYVRKKRKGPKTPAGNRTVQLAPIAIEALEAQREHTRLKGDMVFEDPDRMGPWGGDGAVRKRFWDPLIKATGIRPRPGRQLRHTYASTMLSAGEPLRWVSHQIGHLDPSVTARVYSRFIAEVAPDVGLKGGAAWASVK